MHGADPADIEAIEAFAAMHGLSALGVNAGARTIVLSGPLRSLADALGVDMEGNVRIPECLEDKVIAVLGFDGRSTANSYHQQRKARTRWFFRNRRAHSFTPMEVAQAYQFPPNKGKNQTIALIELGGGFKTADLSAYWKHMGVDNVETIAVSVDGAANQPTGDPSGPDGEVALDVEVAGAVAPEAHLAVYFAPNTDRGFLDALNAAIHDTVRKPSIISISWGAPENQWTPQTLNAFNAAFQDAALLGITVCAASGDNGSSDGESDGAAHVDFPASSPWVLACGGTRLIAKDNKIQSETAWNDQIGGATGGGVSAYFSKPSYQAAIPISGRGVPDVAGNAADAQLRHGSSAPEEVHRLIFRHAELVDKLPGGDVGMRVRLDVGIDAD